MAPRSCRRPRRPWSGADAVAGRGGVARQVGLQVVDRDDHAVVLGDRVPAEGGVGLVEEPMTLGTPAIFSTLGTCPPPQPSMWKAWMVRPSRTRRVSSTERHLVEAVAVQGDLDVVLLGDAQGGVQGAGVGAHVLVHLEAPTPRPRPAPRSAGVVGTGRSRGNRC